MIDTDTKLRAINRYLQQANNVYININNCLLQVQLLTVVKNKTYGLINGKWIKLNRQATIQLKGLVYA